MQFYPSSTSAKSIPVVVCCSVCSFGKLYEGTGFVGMNEGNLRLFALSYFFPGKYYGPELPGQCYRPY